MIGRGGDGSFGVGWESEGREVEGQEMVEA